MPRPRNRWAKVALRLGEIGAASGGIIPGGHDGLIGSVTEYFSRFLSLGYWGG